MRLVILGSSITALAVARDAQAHGLQAVVVDSGDGLAFSSRWVRPVRVAADDADATLAALLDLAPPVAALVATSDRWLRFLADHRATLDAAFVRVLHPANAFLRVCLRKDAFAQWCTNQGLPTPPSWVPGVSERPHGLTTPLLVRPAETLHEHGGLGLPKAVEVHAEVELQGWIERFREAGAVPIVSASLLGHRVTQYSVPFARGAGGTLSFVARKLRPGPQECAQGSLVQWCGGEEVEAIERLARRAADCAGYQGIGEAEILHNEDTGRSHLIEINARPWLQYALAPATGHDLLGFALGRAGPRRPRHMGRTWINLRDDRYNVSRLPQGRPGLWTYLRSVAHSDVYAVFDLLDPMPFLRLVARR